jgi:hypothetical protein
MEYIYRMVLSVYEQERAHLGSHSAVADRLGMRRKTPGERPLAIEHTNIQSFFGQFANNKRFGRLYGELETDLKDAFDFRTRLYLPIFMFQKGTNWKQVRDTIRDWLLQNAHSLPDGFLTVQVSGLPFSFAVHKDGKGSKRFTVARWAPEHEDVDVSHTPLEGKVRSSSV